VIRLRVPGTLAYRNLALRVVGVACKMVGNDELEPSAEADQFEAQTVSAVGEAFNNIAMHAYADMPPGDIDIAVTSTAEAVIIEMIDSGKSYDPSEIAAPNLDEMPESGMGLFIIRSFMDETSYTPGPPSNVLRLVKERCPAAALPSETDEADEAESLGEAFPELKVEGRST